MSVENRLFYRICQLLNGVIVHILPVENGSLCPVLLPPERFCMFFSAVETVNHRRQRFPVLFLTTGLRQWEDHAVWSHTERHIWGMVRFREQTQTPSRPLPWPKGGGSAREALASARPSSGCKPFPIIHQKHDCAGSICF